MNLGRGPLAGPVVVVGCIFKPSLGENIIKQLHDSKKITGKQREYLCSILLENTIYQIEEVSSEEIDLKGISWAISSSVKKIYDALHTQASKTIFDGNWDPINEPDFKVIVKADDLIKEVSAASIIAKVYRDKLMEEYSKTYQVYRFEWNKGYGTVEHINAIKKYGYCPIHRKTFKFKGKEV